MQRYLTMLDRLLLTIKVKKRRSRSLRKSLVRERAIEFTAYLRKEGRVTVPREVRAALNIEEGNLVRCKIEKLGT